MNDVVFENLLCDAAAQLREERLEKIKLPHKNQHILRAFAVCVMKREVPADVPTELENFDDPHETPVVAVERRDAQTALLMEIRRLGAEDQDILMLKYDNKFTVVQIAQALNMDAQVVKKRLQRIRARLKSALEEKGYDTI